MKKVMDKHFWYFQKTENLSREVSAHRTQGNQAEISTAAPSSVRDASSRCCSTRFPSIFGTVFQAQLSAKIFLVWRSSNTTGYIEFPTRRM
ncbi:hypothetical protein GN956_G20287 [Arapaima gigas]